VIRLDKVALGAAPPDDINVIVTTPKGGEPFDVRVDDVSCMLTVTQLYNGVMRAPGNLGIVPHALNDTGDPLPVVLHMSHALAPGMVVAARPIGVLYVSGDGSDTVIVLAVPAARLTQRYAPVKNYADLPAAELRQIAHFFCHFRDLEEHRPQRTAGWGDVNEAHRVIVEAAERARAPIELADR